MKTDAEFSSMASLPDESDISSTFESSSPSPHPSPKSHSGSDRDLEHLLAGRKAPKRHIDDSDADTPDLNKPKRTCTQTNSSIRIALQKEGPPTGILRFFHKATEEERQDFLDRSSEEIRKHAEELRIRELHHSIRKKNKERHQARERKQAQRVRMRKLEIAAGLRSPTGIKRHKRQV